MTAFTLTFSLVTGGFSGQIKLPIKKNISKPETWLNVQPLCAETIRRGKYSRKYGTMKIKAIKNIKVHT